MESISRRAFLGRGVLAGTVAATAAIAKPAKAFAAPATGQTKATFIDLTKCAGCGACVTACRTKNTNRYPDPVDDIPVNWPTDGFEDWQEQRDDTDKLTPYNWIYVEQLEVDGVSVNIPRRCMHCDNPPCANLCPFGVQEKTAEGAVVIDHSGCMGGAKCRDVCAWGIPQRQAGVGLYLNVLPGIMGGGVMYKCDMCADRLAAGGVPACVEACPSGAVTFGDQEEMRALARARTEEIGGHLYGDAENGGTSTFYVSPVAFDRIDTALSRKRIALSKKNRTGVPHMKPNVGNRLDTANDMALGMALGPVVGVAAAAIAAAKIVKGDDAE